MPRFFDALSSKAFVISLLVTGFSLVVFADESRPPSSGNPTVVTIGDPPVVITSEDPNVELKARKRKGSVRIVDKETDEAFEITLGELDIVVGDGRNRLRFVGPTLELTRDGKRIVTVRRAGSASASGKVAAPDPQSAASTGRPEPGGDRASGFPTATDRVRYFEGHTDRVSSVAFSPDGRTAASGSWDGTARIWELKTGKELQRFEAPRQTAGYTGQIGAVVYSPDGKTLAIASTTGKTALWDPKTGELVRTLSGTGYERCLAFSPDGASLMGGSWPGGRPGGTRIWHLNGDASYSWDQPMEWVNSVAFSPDGRWAVCAGGNAMNTGSPSKVKVRVWDVQNGKTLFELENPMRGVVQDAVFARDGRSILARELGPSSRIGEWEIETGELLRHFSAGPNESLLDVSPDGRYLIAASSTGMHSLINLDSGFKMTSSARKGTFGDVEISPDGQYALIAGPDNSVSFWYLPIVPSSTKREPYEVHRMQHDGSVKNVAFSPDGETVFTSSLMATKSLWDAKEGHRLRVTKGKKSSEQVNSVAWSPDGRRLILGCGQSLRTQRLTLWDVDEWREIRSLEGHERVIAKVAFSPDGKWVLSGDITGELCYWQVKNARRLATFDPPMIEIPYGRLGSAPGTRSLAFSPDGKLAACVHGNDARTVRIVDLESGDAVLGLGDHEAAVCGAYFTPDGRQIVAAAGKSISVWDWEEGTVREKIAAPEPIGCLALGPEGNLAATGEMGGTVRVWNLKKGREVRRLTGHAARVSSVAFCPRGEYVASGSADETARIWALSGKVETE